MLSPFLLALVVAMFFNGPVLNAMIANANDPRVTVGQLKAELPEGTRLVSIGRAFHKFLYWWGEPIELLPEEPTEADIPEWADYFILSVRMGRIPELPFEYEEVTLLNMDRAQREKPRDGVFVGRFVRSASNAEESRE